MILNCFSILDRKNEYFDRPLVIAGPGPGWDLFDFSRLRDGIEVFALNHAITELWRRPGVWWVSNDHDRTFQSLHVKSVVIPRIRGYKPWRTITQKQFVPGNLGNFNWCDFRGQPKGPMEWRLPAPDGSTIAYYVAGENMMGHLGWIYNGTSVLELALEVATLWGFSPIVLVGCDMTMVDSDSYYAEAFRYKDTPRKIAVGGRLNVARKSVVDNRGRWTSDVSLVTELWEDPPFTRVNADDALRLLQGECAWSPD